MAEDKKKEETTPESADAQATEESKPKSDLMKYIMFGVGGLVLICGIAFGVAFMMKETPTADSEDVGEKAGSSQVEKSEEKVAHKDDSHIQSEDDEYAEFDEEEFDSKAIEKIVANLATLEYTPTDSELEVADGMSVEDSLEQMSWIEKEKSEIKTRTIELDSREKELFKMEKSVDAKIIRIEHAESNRTSQLAKLYDSMDSRAVAKLMMNLDDNTVVALLPRMKSKNAALVLQLLPSKRAATLSKKMITIAEK